MSDKKETIVSDATGRHIIGKDTTEYHEDGSSTTTHQDASFNMIDGVTATRITGVTENSPDGTSEHHEGSKGGCFLSTACVEHAGLADDCHELTMLRSFRDKYVANLARGPAMLAEYYEIAPALVQQIEQSTDRETVLASIFTTVSKAVALIERGSYSHAFTCYQTMFADLKKRYDA